MKRDVDGEMASSRTMASAALLTTLGTLPVFLIGALAPFVARDLAFDEVELGTTVACFFAASAVSSLVIGRFVEGKGAWTAGATAAIVEVVVLAAAGLVPLSWLGLTLLLIVAGMANATGQLAANLSIADEVPANRRGLAFGVKQSAVPAASLIGGLCVPLVALTVGWQWAFVGAGLVFPIWLALTRRRPAYRVHVRRRRTVAGVVRSSLVVLALSAAAAAAAANAMAAFFVSSAISASVTPVAAGLLLAIGGACGIGSRILLGWLADRAGGSSLRVIAALMTFGAIGFFLISAGSLLAMSVGIVLGYAAGWGWNGLLTFAVAATNPDAPAVATGITQAGVYVGGIVGPLMFGIFAQAVSYRMAWLVAGGLLILAAVLALATSFRWAKSFGSVTVTAFSIDRTP